MATLYNIDFPTAREMNEHTLSVLNDKNNKMVSKIKNKIIDAMKKGDFKVTLTYEEINDSIIDALKSAPLSYDVCTVSSSHVDKLGTVTIKWDHN